MKTMSENEFVEKALSKGFDINWIYESISSYRDEIEQDKKQGVPTFPLEAHLYSLYDSFVRHGPITVDSYPLMPPVEDLTA